MYSLHIFIEECEIDKPCSMDGEVHVRIMKSYAGLEV